MKKPTVRQAKYGTMAIMLLGALILLIGTRTEGWAVGGLGAAVAVLGLILHFAFCRCPHCGRGLGQTWGDHCPFCGKPFEGD